MQAGMQVRVHVRIQVRIQVISHRRIPVGIRVYAKVRNTVNVDASIDVSNGLRNRQNHRRPMHRHRRLQPSLPHIGRQDLRRLAPTAPRYTAGNAYDDRA
jgi:hypothetical protein